MSEEYNVPYQTGCTFENEEGNTHIYTQGHIDSKTFTRSELLSIHLYDIICENNVSRECYRKLVRFVNTVIRDHSKLIQGIFFLEEFITLCSLPCFFLESSSPSIMHGPAVDNLLKANSNVKGHVYSVCVNGCMLFNDEKEECDHCKEKRYKQVVNSLQTTNIPAASIKIISIGDVISQLLGNQKTRKLLRYRAERDTEEGVINDYFDGEDYKNFKKNHAAFENPDDVAIAIYTDGFINENKGKNHFTLIHVIILNYDPFLRFVNIYYI